MNSKNYAFKGTFRTYQQRVLDNIKNLFNDNHLHIVAAPGSGKTILGLEVICRLQKPALILAPTIAIRNQWINRFKEHFTDDDVSDIVSIDLYEPKFLTVITYQSLHAVMSRNEDEKGDSKSIDFNPIDAIINNKIGTICLDEAHHLRKQWQKSLTSFLAELKKINVQEKLHYISLTATPPYDSSANEWKRYMDTCGQIDEEITISELVASGDLCPHQDYVYISTPTEEEHEKLQSILDKPFNAAKELYQSGVLNDLANQFNHKIQTSEKLFDDCLDIEEQLLGFIALLTVFNMDIDHSLDAILHSHSTLAGLGINKTEFSTENIENALEFITLLPQAFKKYTYNQAIDIMKEYKLIKIVSDKIKLIKTSSAKSKKILLSSMGKLQSIADILDSEITVLNENLRQVILTDNIYLRDVDKIGTNENFGHVGVTSIFETVRRTLEMTEEKKKYIPEVAVLTGSLIVVHESIVNKLIECGYEEFDDAFKVPSITPLACGYVKLDFPRSTAQSVSTLTKAFNDGILKIMIGTTSLLGEGWDAPSINSLILASFVKTFMLSNQMRGRAIRKNPLQPDKVANIWHLLTLDNSSVQLFNLGDKQMMNSHDYLYLSKRMENLYALDVRTLPSDSRGDALAENSKPNSKETELSNGLERCFSTPINKALINHDETNNKTMNRSKDRQAVAEGWKNVINANSFQMKYEPQLKVEYIPKDTRSFKVNITDILALVLILVTFFLLGMSSTKWLYIPGFILIGSILIFALIKRKQRINLYNAEKRYHKQANALLKALLACGEIKSKNAKVIRKSSDVRTSVSLINATMVEKTMFSNCVTELSSPPINPRYLLVPNRRLGFSLPLFAQSVPSILSKNSDIVNVYVHELNRAGLKVKAVYTRNSEGRKLLIEARKLALSNTIMGKVHKKRS